MSTRRFTALILDDDQACGESLREMLSRSAIDASHFSDPTHGVDFAKTHALDMAFIDLRMPLMDGIMALKKIKSHSPELLCIMMSGFATIDSAVEAMKYGAYDFLLKPIRRNYLTHTLQKLTDKLDLSREIQELKLQVERQSSKLIGVSPPMVELRRLIRRVAKSAAGVLILGESGTGKELVVDMIHELSDRKHKPLIKLNCGAIPASLVEAELFGVTKGAFTGAHADKMGKFEAADSGTLFLDEVGELPLETQVKILRILQDHTFTRVGSTQERQVDVRIISATNQDLGKLIAAGRFREDLYYRLNVVPLQVPPLRDRTEDIPILMRFFMDSTCKKYDKSERWFTRKALSTLMAYHWPGNVRELRHLCEQLVITSDQRWISQTSFPDALTRDALNPQDSTPTLHIPLGTSLEEANTVLIEKTLSACGGDIQKAAKILGIHPRTIRRRCKPISKGNGRAVP